MELVEYEKNLNNEVTGYKAFEGSEQVGTLEFRNGEWIGATVEDCSIITLRTKCYADAVGWLQLMIKKNAQKKRVI